MTRRDREFKKKKGCQSSGRPRQTKSLCLTFVQRDALLLFFSFFSFFFVLLVLSSRRQYYAPITPLPRSVDFDAPSFDTHTHTMYYTCMLHLYVVLHIIYIYVCIYLYYKTYHTWSNITCRPPR